MSEYNEVLEQSFREVNNDISQTIFDDEENLERIEYVVRCATKSGIRAILACSLAKIVDNSIDIRKPYTEIKDSDSYSGRFIDERYIEPFIFKYDIPANQTTAWLTPAFRTNSSTLKPGINLNGTPAKLYSDVILLLNAVYSDDLSAKNLLKETIRQLLILKKERENRLGEMLEELGDSQEKIPLSSEEIVSLIEQHLNSPKSSRLPVLVVASAYFAAKENLGEKVKSLHSHNAPDSQTGALGDVEITLISSNDIITSYEMKGKDVKRGDIDIAVKKIHGCDGKIDNYIFITTG
jgi:DNA adenine methylase